MLGDEAIHTCLAQTPELRELKAYVLQTTLKVMVFGSLSLLTLFKLIQPRGLQQLWLEVKTLQAWINTAFICAFALFTYPFSIMLILVQTVFVYIRPITNPEDLPKGTWIKQVFVSLLWIVGTISIGTLLIFGTSIESASKKDPS